MIRRRRSATLALKTRGRLYTVSMPSTAALGPNAGLIGRRRAREQLATPALVLDLDVLEHNIAHMAQCCRRANKAVRPHAKSHKSVRIARAQLAAGAIGICVATVREAAVMVAAEIPGILITSPIVGVAKLALLEQLLARGGDLMVVVDSLDAIAPLERTARRSARNLEVLIDVDVGMKRTGVPDVRSAVRLAQRLATCSALRLAGVQCYSGKVQHIARAAQRERTYRSQLEHLERVLAALARHGHAARIVSGGGTGTFDIDRRTTLFTECQPGSYVFMDLQYNAIEPIARATWPFKTSLYVQSMVLSNHHPRTVTLDAGLKSFATEGPLPVPARGTPRGTRYEYFGDEFGKLRLPLTAPTLALGHKVELITPHCDPTVNLHDFYHCVRGDRLVDIWPVDARGTL
jgi:D-serine deaminase-like pyridoxal phosphate-dependent protein